MQINRLLLPALLFSTQLLVAEGNIATFKYGLTSIDNDGGLHLKKHSFRFDALFDQGYDIKPRVGLGYVNIDESKAKGGVSSLVQFDAEGVYELETLYLLTPYAFAGVGYEYVVDSRPNFDSNFYADAGLGVRYPFDNGINLVSEFKALHMLKLDSKQDAEFVFYIGLGLPFGTVKTPSDSDGDSVYDYADMCSDTPIGVRVGLDGCPLVQSQSKIKRRPSATVHPKPYLDSDGDTIPDAKDICPNTPAGVGVNEHGCIVRSSANVGRYGKTRTSIASSHIPVVEATPIVSAPENASGIKGEFISRSKEIDVGHTQTNENVIHEELATVVDSQEVSTEGASQTIVEQSPVQVTQEISSSEVSSLETEMPSLDKRDNVQIKEMVLSDMPTVVSESSDSIEKPMATQGHVETVNYDFQSGLEVRFEPNSEEPLESSKVEIKAFSDYIQSRPDTKMQITGYTDNSGNKDQNLKISEQRAKKVKSLLVSYGISADRMTAIGKGDWNPISSNETQEGRIANRRVEIEIK